MRVRCFKCNTCLVSDAEIISWYAMFINVSTCCLLSVHFDSFSLSIMALTAARFIFRDQTWLWRWRTGVSTLYHFRWYCQVSISESICFNTTVSCVSCGVEWDRGLKVSHVVFGHMQLLWLRGVSGSWFHNRRCVSRGGELWSDTRWEPPLAVPGFQKVMKNGMMCFFFRYWFLFEAFCASRRNSQELQILYIIRFNMTT